MKKTLIIAVLTALLAGFFFFDLGQYLTFEAVKAQVEGAQRTYHDNPVLVIAILVAIYVIVAAASSPLSSVARSTTASTSPRNSTTIWL